MPEKDFDFNFNPDDQGQAEENLDSVINLIRGLMRKYDQAAYEIEEVTKRMKNLTPMLAVVKRRALPLSQVAYGPFALDVYVPELGDDATVTRTAECERTSSGRIVIPKKGSYVTVYMKHGDASRLIWRGMGVEGFPSITKEEKSSKFLQLVSDPLITDIDIYESNKDFSFLLDRTLPALHELVLSLTSVNGKIKISTGPNGKILIGEGETLVDLELDVGGTIKILSGSSPLGTIDIVGGGDITISAGISKIVADASQVDLSAGISNILMTAALIQLKGGTSAVIEPAALATSLNAVLTALISEMSSHVHPTAVGPSGVSTTGATTASTVNALLPNIASKGVTMN